MRLKVWLDLIFFPQTGHVEGVAVLNKKVAETEIETEE